MAKDVLPCSLQFYLCCIIDFFSKLCIDFALDHVASNIPFLHMYVFFEEVCFVLFFSPLKCSSILCYVCFVFCLAAKVSMWGAEAGLGLVVSGKLDEGKAGTAQTNLWETETLLGAAGAQFLLISFSEARISPSPLVYSYYTYFSGLFSNFSSSLYLALHRWLSSPL